MNRKVWITVLILIFFSAPLGAEVYLWPVPGLRSLSSTFGEYREGHFHAGIDIRSFGERGLPCFAVSDGYVERVKIRPGGYGRALYLKLNDGITAVYAHLYGFCGELDSLTYNRMALAGESWCDLHLPKGKYGFHTGDTVAYAGRSGTVFPHLHFELRDSSGRPINPLAGIYSVPDQEPPFISGLEIIPLSPGSVVDGSFLSKIMFFKASGRNSFAIENTIHLEGSFGFGISAWDEQKFGGYKMGPHSIMFFVDGEPAYELENESFSYDQSGEVRYEYNRYGEGWSNRYRTLFKIEGNSLSGRKGPGIVTADSAMNRGLNLDIGPHTGEILVSDAAGNGSWARFNFVIHDFPEIGNSRKLDDSFEVIVSGWDPDGGEINERVFESTDGGSRWKEASLESYGDYRVARVSPLENGVYKYLVCDDEGACTFRYFASPKSRPGAEMVFCQCKPVRVAGGLGLEIITDRILASLPKVETVHAGGEPALSVIQSGERNYFARFGLQSLKNGVNVFRVSGLDYRGYSFEKYHASIILVFESGVETGFELSDSLLVKMKSRSVNGSSPCIVQPASTATPVYTGKTPISTPFSLDFSDDAFFLPITVSGVLGELSGLYRFEPKDSAWDCIGIPQMAGGSVEVREGGIYCFFRDALPPRIGEVKIEEVPPGSGYFKNFMYYVPVEDLGSGVDPYSSDVYWNGELVVSHWDGIRNNLYIPVTASKSKERVELRVEISDRNGNRAVEEFGFMLQ